MKINDTRQYVNQYYDVIDRKETAKIEGERTCNVSCVAMITGEDVNDVFQWFVDKYGWSDKFQWEETIIAYLNERGFTAAAITPVADRCPTRAELDDMCHAIDQGLVVLYHKYGHYQLMVGYDESGYIFNDPAGDRKLPRADRARESGHLVHYPKAMIENEKRYGQCYAVAI